MAELTRTFAHLATTDLKYYDPTTLAQALNIRTDIQQDAHECVSRELLHYLGPHSYSFRFLQLLIDMVDTKLTDIDNEKLSKSHGTAVKFPYSPASNSRSDKKLPLVDPAFDIHRAVRDTFEGEAIYLTTCSKCKNVSTVTNAFSHLALNIEGKKKLMECLSANFEEEKIEGYECDGCRSKQTASREHSITKLPNVTFICPFS